MHMDTEDVSTQVHVQNRRGRNLKGDRAWRQDNQADCRHPIATCRARARPGRQGPIALSPSYTLDAVHAGLDRLPAHTLRPHTSTNAPLDDRMVRGPSLLRHLADAQTRHFGNDRHASTSRQARPPRFGLRLDMEPTPRLDLVQNRRTASGGHPRAGAPKPTRRRPFPRYRQSATRRQATVCSSMRKHHV